LKQLTKEKKYLNIHFVSKVSYYFTLNMDYSTNKVCFTKCCECSWC